ncbi:MAG: hypothetical protein H6559_00005, partial [Lewinellaceae bacterium]|nr:hypothetical protein [Lewinellaceae bacterium]
MNQKAAKIFHAFSKIHLQLITLLCIVCSSVAGIIREPLEVSLFPPPVNDGCSNPSLIELPTDGWGTGVVYSDTIDITQSTSEAMEFFPEPGQWISIWYEMELPTHRSVKIELKQVGNTIPLSDCKFVTYMDSACLPGLSEANASTLAYPTGFGYTSTPCLAPGAYRIQVYAKPGTSGSVYLEATLGYPFEDNSEFAPHDRPQDALQFGILNTAELTASIPVGCHSLDSLEEAGCPMVAEIGQFGQSIWMEFQTDSIVDIVSLELEENFPDITLPDVVLLRLFKGKASQAPWQSLEVLQECVVLKKSNISTTISRRWWEALCELEPKTDYAIQILFPNDFEAPQIQVNLHQRGEQLTTAPTPDPGLNNLGVLPHQPTGAITIITDYFSCNAFTADNPCGWAQPESGVVPSGIYPYDLAWWFGFTLETHAHVRLNWLTSIPNTNMAYVRIFFRPLATDCIIYSEEGIVGEFSGTTGYFPCLPPGDYSVQVLGRSQYPYPQNANNYQTALDLGMLGRVARLQLTTTTTYAPHPYALSAVNDVYYFNDGAPLAENNLYAATPAVFGCAETVLPESVSCEDIDRAIYREIITNEGGLLELRNLRTQRASNNQITQAYPDFSYAVYLGSANAEATNSNTFLPGDSIPGLTPLSPCITETDNQPFPIGLDSCFVCVPADTISLLTFANERHINLYDQPSVRFHQYGTLFTDPESPYDFGDITNQGIYISPENRFSCIDNPMEIGGLTPCGNSSKLVFHVFHLDESRIVNLRIASNRRGQMRLFNGDIRDTSAILTAYNGINSNCQPWSGCFFQQQASGCDLLPPGDYTVVVYGHGPGFENPFIPPLGNKGDIGSPCNVILEVWLPELPQCSRPDNACPVGLTDWDISNENDPLASTARVYHLEEVIVPCYPDSLRTHPVAGCRLQDTMAFYYPFEITKPAFVSFDSIPAVFPTVVFPFDVQESPQLMLSTPPVYPCVESFYRQFCNLQPGKYTLVVFASLDESCYALEPVMYVDKAGISLHDYAATAYDFGVIPDDNTYHNGAIGDMHPYDPSLPPSLDHFYCTTGASSTDPVESQDCGDFVNPAVSSAANQVLYDGTTQSPGHLFSRRNLWWTFVIEGKGTIAAKVDLPASNSLIPTFAIYRSDVDGDIPFEEVVQNGEVDSTLAQGLTLIYENFTACDQARNRYLSFSKNDCPATRYYIVATMPARNPNLPVALSIKLYPLSSPPAPYDHFSTANHINGLNETFPPYTEQALTEGVFLGAPFNLTCYSKDPADPLNNIWYTKSAYYKAHIDAPGFLRLAHEKNGNPSSRKEPLANDVRLYHALVPGDSTQLVEVPLTLYQFSTDPQDTSGHNWMQSACLDAGEYYVFITDNNGFRPFSNDTSHFRPIVWYIPLKGDHCQEAVPLNIQGGGSASATLWADCLSWGGDVGEEGQAEECVPSAGDFVSAFFKVKIEGSEKVDLVFHVNNYTNTPSHQFILRFLLGTCTIMTENQCVPSGNTVFSAGCVPPGEYYVQVFVPETTNGKFELEVNSTVSPDQDCRPVTQPTAYFEYSTNCDSVYFENKSTTGGTISYLWYLPGGVVSTEQEPSPVHALSIQAPFLATLAVQDLVYGLSDTFSLWVQPQLGHSFTLLTETICEGGEFPFAGETLTATGTYYDSLQTWQGCDSVVQLDLIVTERSFIQLDTQACQGDTMLVAGQAFSSSGDYNITLEGDAASGCDSIVQLSLEVIEPSIGHLEEKICQGDSLQAGGQYFSANGDYEITLEGNAASGCDSIVQLSLEVIEPSIGHLEEMICQGDSLQAGGQYFSA